MRSPATRSRCQTETASIILEASVRLALIRIPAGTFWMGSPDTEIGRMDPEGPIHPVRITRGLWMGAYPVTRRQYEAVMGGLPMYFTDSGPDDPADGISWHLARAFCQMAATRLTGRLTGLTVRLPAEAEWEYACRGGSTSALYNGRELSSAIWRCEALDPLGWYLHNSRYSPHPVGRKQPNAWDLYDMLGNVSEWCEDGPRLYDGTPQVNPWGRRENGYVSRGGCWSDGARYARCACRTVSSTGDAHVCNGFRIVVVDA